MRSVDAPLRHRQAPRRSPARPPCPRRPARRRCIAVRARLIRHADEELRAAAVRPPGLQHRRNRAARAGSELSSAFSAPKPPVPNSDAFDGSFDSGSPPWTMPVPDTRWNVVPSYRPVARQLHEIADMVRRRSASSAITKVPRVVSTTACLWAIWPGVSGVLKGSARVWRSGRGQEREEEAVKGHGQTTLLKLRNRLLAATPIA